MSKFLQYVMALFFVGVSGYFLYEVTRSPCDQPLAFSIGQFDTQFGVSKQDFINQIAEAEKPWEKVLNKDFFTYDEKAEFKINLIYDDRQQTTIQKQKTEFGLSSVEDILKKLDSQFSVMKASYENQVGSYKSTTASFEKRQKDYESKVDYWNQKGGAPKEEYESLKQEMQALNLEAARLNTQAASLNAKSEELNVLLDKRNAAANEYNKVAKNYNQKYGHGLEFNQAEYTGEAINVYQFGDRKDLTLALAHELGHALGMDHVENANSIMYYLTSENNTSNITPSLEDLAELKRVCKID